MAVASGHMPWYARQPLHHIVQAGPHAWIPTPQEEEEEDVTVAKDKRQLSENK